MTPLDPTWADLTPDERLEQRLATWLEPPGVEFVSAEAAATYKAARHAGQGCAAPGEGA